MAEYNFNLELSADEAYLVQKVLSERLSKFDMPEDDDYLVWEVKNRISDWLFEHERQIEAEFKEYKASTANGNKTEQES